MPTSHTFSDVKTAGELNYTSLDATKYFKDLVNSLTIRTQAFRSSGVMDVKTVRENLKKANDFTQVAEDRATQTESAYTWQDPTRIAKYGLRATEIQTNLRLPSAESLAFESVQASAYGSVAYYNLLDKLTSQRQNPRLILHKLTWNAQADIHKAQSFELGQKILVKRGTFPRTLLLRASSIRSLPPDGWSH